MYWTNIFNFHGKNSAKRSSALSGLRSLSILWVLPIGIAYGKWHILHCIYIGLCCIFNPLATMVHYTDTLMKILLVKFKAYSTTRD